MRRYRHAKIIATLGPASTSYEEIESLFKAGTDIFRLNFSHGSHSDHEERVRIIREIERHTKRPIAIMMDLQGPKLRVGTFAEGKVLLKEGDTFRLDLEPDSGSQERAYLPHPEIFKALKPDTDLLLDDGKLRLKVKICEPTFAETQIIVGGELSNRKGVNVPNVALPISALTTKDKQDLEFGINLGVDWIALSFVQKPEDITEAKNLMPASIKLMAKLEKPQAIEHLDEIVNLADGIMVARGDLGVEMLPEEVPGIQKRIIQICRHKGKPVVVATQMLDSMVNSPSPTRAEASDVATAIYDGVDAVMLSAESASGKYPMQSVTMMDRIIRQVEQDTIYRQMLDNSRSNPLNTDADAVVASARQVAHTINISAIVTFTETGSTTLRAARERPESSIIALTPNLNIARSLAMVWGVHSLVTEEVYSFSQMVETSCQIAYAEEFAKIDDSIVVIAGMPFGESGGTNILRIAKITEKN